MNGKCFVIFLLMFLSHAIWASDSNGSKILISYNINGNACSDTLIFLNGKRKTITYIKQANDRIYFKECKGLGTTQTIRAKNIYKIKHADGSEEILNQKNSDKKYRGKGDNRVWVIIGVALAIPVLAFGLILLGFVLFPQW